MKSHACLVLFDVFLFCTRVVWNVNADFRFWYLWYSGFIYFVLSIIFSFIQWGQLSKLIIHCNPQLSLKIWQTNSLLPTKMYIFVCFIVRKSYFICSTNFTQQYCKEHKVFFHLHFCLFVFFFLTKIEGIIIVGFFFDKEIIVGYKYIYTLLIKTEDKQTLSLACENWPFLCSV